MRNYEYKLPPEIYGYWIQLTLRNLSEENSKEQSIIESYIKNQIHVKGKAKKIIKSNFLKMKEGEMSKREELFNNIIDLFLKK